MLGFDGSYRNTEIVQGNKIPDDRNEENRIYISKGAGAGGGNGKLQGLFKYILVKKNGIQYELNFMRFFIDTENNVNCILKAIQFDRCVGEYVNKCDGICYPGTSKWQTDEELKSMLNQREGKSFCYNPDVSFLINLRILPRHLLILLINVMNLKVNI